MNKVSTELIFIKDKSALPVDKSWDKIWVKDIIDDTKPILESNNYGKFYLLDTEPGKCRRIQFLETGYVRTARYCRIKKGTVRDPYHRSVIGIGYLGDYKTDDIMEFFGEELRRRYHRMWINMIKRATGNQSSDAMNKLYEDAWVHKSFHSCEDFLRWVMRASKGKEHLLPILHLDKDYYGARYYSEHTCVLLTKQENTALISKNRWFIIDNKLLTSKQKLAKYLTNVYNVNGLIRPKLRKDGYIVVNKSRFKKVTDELKDKGILKEITPNTRTVNGNLVRFRIQDPMVEEEMKYKLYDYSEMIIN